MYSVASLLANTQQSIHDVEHVVLSRHSIQTKKREKLSFLSLVPRAGVEVRSTSANTIERRPQGRAINHNLVRATAN